MTWLFHVGLVCVACVGGLLGVWHTGVFADQLPWGLLWGTGIGCGCFVISFLVTTPFSKIQIRSIFGDISRIDWTLCGHTLVMYAVLTALYEEWVWRVGLQSFVGLWLGDLWGVVITAVLFTGVHGHRFQGRLVRMIELGIFSLVLGGLFAVYQNFWLVFIVHACRNALTVIYRFGVLAMSPSENP